MKDSKQVRSEYQSFVESYSSIAAKGAEEAKATEMKKKPAKKDDDCECKHEMVLMRKSGAFTELAEKYQMNVKQFARFVENNQGLFDIETRKKAILANKFSGFKESVEWDEFFGDLELVEDLQSKVKGALDKAANFMNTNPVGKAAKKVLQPVGAGRKTARPTGGDKTQLTREEVEELQEIQTKETAAGTKYKVRVKEKESGSSYIRYATREKIAQLRADPKIASVEMTDEGEAPEDKGEKKAQEKGGGLAVKARKMKEKKEREAAAPAKPAKRSVTTEAKKLDPVGEEDADIDNDNDVDKSDEYLHKRRKAIGKAMKKRGTKKESFSNWREDLREITDVQDAKKIKGGKVNNKVVINPPMGEGFDPEKVAEALGAELIDCEEQVNPKFTGASGANQAMDFVDKSVTNSPQRQKNIKDVKDIKKRLDAAKMEAVEPDGGGSAPQVPAPVAKFVDELPQNAKKAVKKIKKMVTGEAVEAGPILPGEKGKRIFPKGQEPKPTGAKLPPVQKAGFEPEGDQLDEAIPLAIGAGIAGAGLVGAALMRAKQATSSKNRNDSTIGKPTLQGAASAIRKRNEMLRQAGGQ